MSNNQRRSGRVLLPLVVVLLVVVGLGAYLFNRYRFNQPVTYDDLTEHFKYGSIGGDVENGLPLEVMKVLPTAFPEYLPAGSTKKDYTAFGFIQEAGHDMPIGFSERQHLIPRVGLNCAPCHVGEWRAGEDQKPTVYLGMPAVTLDITSYFQFLFDVAGDPRFNGDYLIPLMQANGAKLNLVDRFVYAKLILPKMRDGLLFKERQFQPLFNDDHPAFGPGRVDTFNPYKVNQFAAYYPDGVPFDESIGTVDYPAIWEQGDRQDLPLNWDGNSPTIHDRNVGAAFGAGATRESIDMAAIDRVTQFLRNLPAPAYPWGITADSARLEHGKELYDQHCASCHALDGDKIGDIEPLDVIGTDPYRVNSYTDTLNSLMLSYGEGYDWKLLDMVKTDGYANQPLDGIWARAPYLHNGSVPTLHDLLLPEDQRPTTFYAGSGVYDTVNVGMRDDITRIGDKQMFLFDTAVPGNSNKGHSGPYFGTNLSESDRQALIEYLKTIR